MNGLPVLNRPITLIADFGQAFASRVEDVGEYWLTVAKPLDLPVEHPFLEGAEFMTTWKGHDGIYVLPCQLLNSRREGVVRLWDMGVVGQPWHEQRRAYVRARASGTVTMRWSLDGETEYESCGALEDLSEAALRFVCRDDRVLAQDVVGATVSVSLSTRYKSFELQGDIVRIARSAVSTKTRESGPWDVVVRFTDPGKAADDLRRIVFREQLRDRNGH
jgi:c-di-GMP-binding flagellar brake protein YcgR